MNRCAKCKSGLMNDKSFEAHHIQYHADQKLGSDLEKVAVAPLTRNNDKSNSPRVGEPTGQRKGNEAREIITPKFPPPCAEAINKKISTGRSKSENLTSRNTENNTSTSDLNDSVETMDKIEDFLNNSKVKEIETCVSKENLNKSTPGDETQSESNASVSNKHTSTPQTKKVKQKIKNDDDIEKQVVKRRRSSTKSASKTPVSPKKRSRISTRDSFTDDPVKDTDPRHPTSSISL